MVTRRQQFDDLVLDSAARLEPRLGPRFEQVEFAVEDVPTTDPAPWERDGVPLGRVFPSHGRQPARIVIYRRPIEARAQDQRELTAIVGDVVVEQVAALFGMAPGDLDPRYDTGDD
ncbi:metallopeptidase family protein [Phycicoccus sp. Soil748]|uniref:metallopeptidase family protein n=1 Tax=Phycicoccus sp. Soil748 TaxID=1736397 RepID=UPI0007033282|nr:metallopeptidase family protein [Phycicoccus sp. Soil748]KRE57142.1 peptidase [Phycicoccus sp. Soil748]